MSAPIIFRTVADVLDWYTAHDLKTYAPVSLLERQRIWRLFRQQAGAVLLDDCCPLHLLGFIGSQEGARSNWTRRRIKATICRPFNAACNAGLISRSPFRGVCIPQGRNGRDWSDGEYRAILRASPPYFRRFVVFLRFTGARPGEGRTLEWNHVRDDVEAIVQELHKTGHVTLEPRRIHFNDVLVKLLIWLRQAPQSRRYVFCNKFGRPWTIAALTKHFRSIRARCGLPSDVRLHGGRHTFSTAALLNGVDICTLAELIGHKSVRSTERYVHLLNKRAHLNRAMNQAIGHARVADPADGANVQPAYRTQFLSPRG